MKTNAQVDAIMEAIPQEWRFRWCGGERGACACLGCVQIGNKAVIWSKINGRLYRGDPEYINEENLRKSEPIYSDYKLSIDEWLAWKERVTPANPELGK